MSFMLMVAWRCDLCGHVWLARGWRPPELCARCRKRRWNTWKWDKKVEVRDPEFLDVEGVGTLEVGMVEGVGMALVKAAPPQKEEVSRPRQEQTAPVKSQADPRPIREQARGRLANEAGEIVRRTGLVDSYSVLYAFPDGRLYWDNIRRLEWTAPYDPAMPRQVSLLVVGGKKARKEDKPIRHAAQTHDVEKVKALALARVDRLRQGFFADEKPIPAGPSMAGEKTAGQG